MVGVISSRLQTEMRWVRCGAHEAKRRCCLAWLRMASRPETTARAREGGGWFLDAHLAALCTAMRSCRRWLSSHHHWTISGDCMLWIGNALGRDGGGDPRSDGGKETQQGPHQVAAHRLLSGSSVDTPLMVIAPEAGHKYRILCEMGCVPPNWPRPAPISRPYDR